jgi:hypothetical protein
MSAPQFTPGPWWTAGFSSIVGNPVCAQPDKTKNTFNVCSVAAPVSREENIANARLIAAAPDLLAACEAQEELWQYVGDDARPAINRVQQMRRAALAKARDASEASPGTSPQSRSAR